MNYNVDDIVKRLVNGEKSDDIAGELTGVLNNAIEKYKEIQEAEAKKACRDKRLNELASDIVDAINAYLGELAPEEKIEVDVKDVKGIVDSFLDLYKLLKDMDTMSMKDIQSLLKLFN